MQVKSKSLPNDPEREGNIWHQYELLERAHKALEAQLAEERLMHKKVCPISAKKFVDQPFPCKSAELRKCKSLFQRGRRRMWYRGSQPHIHDSKACRGGSFCDCRS